MKLLWILASATVARASQQEFMPNLDVQLLQTLLTFETRRQGAESDTSAAAETSLAVAWTIDPLQRSASSDRNSHTVSDATVQAPTRLKRMGESRHGQERSYMNTTLLEPASGNLQVEYSMKLVLMIVIGCCVVGGLAALSMDWGGAADKAVAARVPNTTLLQAKPASDTAPIEKVVGDPLLQATSAAGLSSDALSIRTVVAVGAVFCVKFLIIGVFLSFGALLPPLLQLYGAPESASAAVGSSAEAAFNLTCLVAGSVVQRRGPLIGFVIGACCFCTGLYGDSAMPCLKGWYVTHGLVGVGMGFLDMSVMGMIHRHTPVQLRGTCVGFASLGSGLGMAVISSCLFASIQSVGLQSSLLRAAVASALVLSAALSAMYWLEKTWPGDEEELAQEEASSCSAVSVWSIFQQHSVFFIGIMLYAVAYFVPYNYIKVVALSSGLAAKEVATLPVLMGLGECAGLLLFGAISDFLGQSTLVFVATTVLACATMSALSFCASFLDYSVFSVVYGSMTGGRAGLLSLVCLELFGAKHMISGFGLLCSMFILSSLGSPIVGAVYDYDGSYVLGLHLMAGAMWLSVPLFCLTLARVKR